jgi:phage terminase Nu1 subunit (DNA packaging protein)
MAIPTPAPPQTEAGIPVRPLINRNQLASAASVSLRTIDAWREDGIIPYFQIRGVIRFDMDQVMAALRERYEVRGKTRAVR